MWLLKMKMEHLTFQTHCVKRKENIRADALSHNPCSEVELEDEIDKFLHTVAINMVIFDKTSSDYPSNASYEVSSDRGNAIASSDSSSALVDAVNPEYVDMDSQLVD
jgi:hypothetical protein